MPKFTILGSGFTGLAMAYSLVEHGFKEIRVLSSEARAGGVLFTEKSEFGPVESAAVGLVRTKLSEELFAKVGAQDREPSEFISNRYIFRGEPTKWPLTVLESLGLAPAILKYGFGSLKPEPDKSLRAWGDQVLPSAALEYLLEPGLQGIYGGDSNQLSASLVLKKMFGSRVYKAKKSNGTITMYPLGGMSDFIEKMKAHLQSLGVLFETVPPYSNVANLTDQCDQLFVCSGLPSFGSLNFSGTGVESWVSKLSELPLLDLGSVHLFTKRRPQHLKGYGCLFPGDQGFHSLGVQLNAGLFLPDDRGWDCHRFIFGKSPNCDARTLSEDNLMELALSDYQRLYGELPETLQSFSSLWRRVIPHYGLELERALRTGYSSTRIQFFGNYMGGVGLSDILEKTWEHAKNLEAN